MAEPRRLARLPALRIPALPEHDIRVATTRRARLIGLAGLPAMPERTGLLLPRTRSVHTFGMRFALDLVWLDSEYRAIRIDRAVSPRRLASCRRARAVVELASSAIRGTRVHPAWAELTGVQSSCARHRASNST